MNALSLFLPAVALASTLSPAGHQRPQAPPRGAASGAPLALSTISPRQIGPAVTSGRVISIAVHPTDKTTWYVGAACGGVWKTTNNGTTFTPIFDNEASYSIGTITIDPKRPNIVWVGSGENNAQRSVGWGDGVYKSEDGGRSWKNMGLKSSEHIGKIIVDPRNPDTVWVAAQGPLWSAGGERGLYRTTDGGKTWKEVYRSGRKFELIWKASFVPGGDTGYATVQSYDPERATQLVIRSDDRGRTWREIAIAQDKTARQFGIGFVNADVGFVGTAAGGFATSDGGKTWERAPIARAANKFQAVATDKGVRLYAIGTEVQAIDLPR